MNTRSPLHETLRQATREPHHRLDHHPALMPLVRPGLSADHYARVLQTLCALVSPLEQSIASALRQFTPESAHFWQGRAHLLADDLTRLGAEVPPGDPGLPAIDSLETLIGFLYTLEGSTQGGQLIAREVSAHSQSQLPVRYFSCDQGDAQARWQAFWQFAEHCQPEPYGTAQAAQRLFEHIRLAFDPLNEPSPAP